MPLDEEKIITTLLPSFYVALAWLCADLLHRLVFHVVPYILAPLAEKEKGFSFPRATAEVPVMVLTDLA